MKHLYTILFLFVLLTFNASSVYSSNKTEENIKIKTVAEPSGHITGNATACQNATAPLIKFEVKDENGSWVFKFEYDKSSDQYTVQKGSVCVNGVSLTVVESETGMFSVAIIPYTYEHTMLHTLAVGDSVNLEYDIVGKYIANMMRI